MIQSITIKFTAPETSYSIKIKEVHELNNQLIAISELRREEGGSEAMTDISDSISVSTTASKELPVKHYVILTENSLSRWHNSCRSKRFAAIESRNEIKEAINETTCRYKAPESSLEVDGEEDSNESTLSFRA